MPSENKKRFICDAMLGTLARRLRLLGYDCVYQSDIEDDHLLRKSRSEERVLLTRDGPLAKRKGAYRLIFIESEDVEKAVSQLERDRVITAEEQTPFTRCLECGGELFSVEDKRSLYIELPPYVYWNHEDFKQCGNCRRVFWAGTHLSHLKRRIKKDQL